MKRLSSVGAAFSMAVMLIGCRAEPPAPEPVVRPVRYVKVFSTGGQRTRAFSGVARPGTESRLSFRVAGTIERVAVKVGDRVRRGQLIARLDPIDYDDANADVRQGMAAEVTFEFSGDGDGPRYLVPSEAVAEDRQGRLVFVVEPGGDGMGTARRRSVTVGELTAGGLEVIDGLSDGELVVTGGVSRIEDAQRVRLPPLSEP